ncbi:type II secretion system protein GspL [Vibrio sinensis]|uniref:Type II secretion system protein L n=1 Tax=Vibrio sinensis TaxID=2302434 RepID=A0A3A6QPB1_9VIBR|nr:type II secretion system protein GspL [Vibrio sinensis]RJX72436.1 type II secretion system protein GspL [Vibrio sinensis]
MSEFLIVRLSKSNTANRQWLVWSENQHEVIASGDLMMGQPLSDIASYANQRPTIVLLSGMDVILKNVEIPAGASRQFDSMLPYLLEDDIAQDVDQLHFNVLNKQDGRAQVCAVELAWLEAQVQQLQEQGFNVRKVLPDVLALPDVEGIAAVELAGNWLLKKSAYQGMVVESDWLAMMAKSDWVKEDGEYLPLNAYSALPTLELADDQQWHNDEPQLVMSLLAKQAIKSKINLLTGKLKPKSSALRHLKVWQKTAVAAGVLVAVLFVSHVMQTQNAEAQAAAYRAESERIFRSVMQGKQRIPTVSYLKREMERETAVLSGGSSDDSILNWLDKLPTALAKVPGFILVSFKFDQGRGELRLQAQSKDFQSFEQARIELAKQFNVEQGQLSKTGNQVNGTLVLKRL